MSNQQPHEGIHSNDNEEKLQCDIPPFPFCSGQGTDEAAASCLRENQAPAVATAFGSQQEAINVNAPTIPNEQPAMSNPNNFNNFVVSVPQTGAQTQSYILPQVRNPTERRLMKRSAGKALEPTPFPWPGTVRQQHLLHQYLAHRATRFSSSESAELRAYLSQFPSLRDHVERTTYRRVPPNPSSLPQQLPSTAGFPNDPTGQPFTYASARSHSNNISKQETNDVNSRSRNKKVKKTHT